MTDDDARQAQARLDAWRERGGELADPVRFHYLQALARRAAGHEGQARQLLDQRLAGLMAACPDTPAPAPRAEADQARTPGPLGQLCAQIAAAAPARPAYPELPLLDEFRQTWTRLSTDRQLRQSEQLVPENAGPLNSSHLAHRSLSLMQGLSPGYLQQFLSYVDALGWLEQLAASAAPAARESARATPRKTARGRAR